MRSLIWLAGLMLVANTALAQSAGWSRSGGSSSSSNSSNSSSSSSGDGFLLGTNASADNVTRVGLMLELQSDPGVGSDSNGDSLRAGTSAIDFGVEFTTSLPSLGSMVRYHASLVYSNFSVSGQDSSLSVGFNGFKVAPLGFGWAFPVYRQGPFHLEIEGVVSALEFQFFSASQGGVSATDLIFSTGFYGQITASYGRAYLSLAPVGFDLTWLNIDTASTFGGSNTDTAGGLAPEYRFQVSGGVSF